MTGPGPGSWQPDPEGRYEYRWWDGRNWTEQVSHQGQTGSAPMGSAPPQGGQGTPAQGAPQAAPAAQPSGDGFAGITGETANSTKPGCCLMTARALCARTRSISFAMP